jgi:hypothetical protein
VVRIISNHTCWRHHECQICMPVKNGLVATTYFPIEKILSSIIVGRISTTAHLGDSLWDSSGTAYHGGRACRTKSFYSGNSNENNRRSKNLPATSRHKTVQQQPQAKLTRLGLLVGVWSQSHISLLPISVFEAILSTSPP